MKRAEERAYRLGQYEIIEGWDGAIRWETHTGLAGLKGGGCFLEGKVLVLEPPEIEKPGYFKTEFLEHLRKLPPWQKTKYYCHSYAFHKCKTGTRTTLGRKGGSLRKGTPSRLGVFHRLVQSVKGEDE
jgi:hypothetical protein